MNSQHSTQIHFTVMSLNLWQWSLAIHHGIDKSAQFVADAIRAAGADVTGFQESNDEMVRAAAELLGYHVNIKTGTDLSLISKYPVKEVDDQNDYYLIEVAPWKAVAFSNVHLSHEPYGPYDIAGGKTAEEVIETEHRFHMQEMSRHFIKLPALTAQGMPMFLTGDFNITSHLDWTEATKHIHHSQVVEWPVSKKLQEVGMHDSYRVMHPDPVTAPGNTWPAEGTEWREAEMYDRIDFVYAGGPAVTLDSKVVGERKVKGGPPSYPELGLDSWLSDHRAVASTFRVKPRSYHDMVWG